VKIFSVLTSLSETIKDWKEVFRFQMFLFLCGYVIHGALQLAIKEKEK